MHHVWLVVCFFLCFSVHQCFFQYTNPHCSKNSHGGAKQVRAAWFGVKMNLDGTCVNLECLGHRSKVRVTRSKIQFLQMDGFHSLMTLSYLWTVHALAMWHTWYDIFIFFFWIAGSILQNWQILNWWDAFHNHYTNTHMAKLEEITGKTRVFPCGYTHNLYHYGSKPWLLYG